MKIALASTELAKSACDLLAVPVFAEEMKGKKRRSTALVAADRALGGIVLETAAAERFQGKADQSLSIHTHGDMPARRLLLLGLGTKDKFSPEVLRQAAGRAARAASSARAKIVALALPEVRDLAHFVKAGTEGFVLGAYRYAKYKTSDRKGERTGPTHGLLILPPRTDKGPSYASMRQLGAEIAEATNWARDLVNEPAMAMTPSRLAGAAGEMARRAGLKCHVLGREGIERLKMGMFLGVAQGSAQEPKLVHLVYEPSSRKGKKAEAVAFVGKAITFDSGGLSLKPSDSMTDMKTDMAGAAAVFGAMRVIARIEPPFPVHAFVGACENMPGGRAYRLGDVLVSRSGKTVEVMNTDAEGRLVMGDVLTWAIEHKPGVVIDLATLTGACMVALGQNIAGAFGDHEATMQAVLDAAKAAGEELWRLPLAEDQRDSLKGDIADLKNTGERWGGAISAALFLKEFVGSTPWVHLDIAGPSTCPKERGYFVKGATGVGVRTLVEFVRQRL